MKRMVMIWKMMKMRTFEEILTETANENSYESWDELMYDSHPHWQIKCTKDAFRKFLEQFPKDMFVDEVLNTIKDESDSN